MAERGVRSHLEQVQLPYWEFLGNEVFDAPNNQRLTIPSSASVIYISVEGQAGCYWDIGQGFCDTSSAGYIPAESREILGPLADIVDQGMWIHAPDSTRVHVSYFREN